MRLKGANQSAPLTEAQYLAEQSAAARAAISAALADLKADVVRVADPRRLLHTHPWITLASAAVAGFAAAATAIPSKEQQALRRLEAIQRAMHAREVHPKNGNGNGGGDPGAANPGIGAFLIKEAIGFVKPILLTVLSAQMNPQGPAAPTDDPTRPASSENGA